MLGSAGFNLKLLEGESGIQHAIENLHVFVSMGYDWPVEIDIDNKHAIGTANDIVVNT